MTVTDLAEFGKVFGLPGLVLLCWFLLERDKNKRNEKLEMAKVEAEREKTAAMSVGFQSLSGAINAHHTADITSHGELATGIAEIKGMLTERGHAPEQPKHRPDTSPRGVAIVREVARGKSQGER